MPSAIKFPDSTQTAGVRCSDRRGRRELAAADCGGDAAWLTPAARRCP